MIFDILMLENSVIRMWWNCSPRLKIVTTVV